MSEDLVDSGESFSLPDGDVFLQKAFALARERVPLFEGMGRLCRDVLERADLGAQLERTRTCIRRLEEVEGSLQDVAAALRWLELRGPQTGLRIDAASLLRLYEQDVRDRLLEERRWRKWLLAELKKRDAAAGP